ncbi:MAG: hypothetical protein RIT45_82 [Pseudomonadota bacterium]
MSTRTAPATVATPHRPDRTLRRRVWALAWSSVLWTAAAVWPGTALAIDGKLPTRDPIITPGQESALQALVAPWQDGGAAAAGFRWDGVRVDQFRACYLFSRAEVVREFCLVSPSAAAKVAPETPGRPLPSGAALISPKAGALDADATALLDATTERMRANGEAILPTMWSLVEEVQQAVMAPHLLQDPLLWPLALAFWLLLVSARSIRDLPGRGWPWIFGLLAAAAWLRWTISVEAPMTAWSWTRWTRGASTAMNSPILGAVLDETHWVWADHLQSTVMRTAAVATPLAILGHSRKVFGHSVPALAAAVLLVTSPHHLRFSASDVQFIPSMLWSSCTFLFLYELLELRRWLPRLLGLVGFVPLLVTTLTARPLNLFYAPLLLLALAMAAQHAQPRWRQIIGAVIVAAAGWVTFSLLTRQTEAVHGALQPSVVEGALTLLLRPDYDPLLFFRLTPPVWFPLIVAGAFAMVGLGEGSTEPQIARRRGLWLVGWLLGFIVLHGVVVVEEPLNNARYQLHSLPAMAMLAGVGFWRLWHRGGRARAMAAFCGVLALAAPWMHEAAIRDVDFVTQRERALLTAFRTEVPPECTMLEVYTGRPDHEEPGAAEPPPSKVARPALRVRGFRTPKPAWQQRTLDGHRPLDDETRALLTKPPRCLLFFESVDCAVGPGQPGVRPTCREVLDAAHWEVLREDAFPARIYDEGLVHHLRAPGDPVRLRILRHSGPRR